MKTWAEFEFATAEQIIAWAQSQPWARSMAECQQDALWHAEGDVWTHTLMVTAELQRLSEWPSLDQTDRLKLLLTALFHDSGKPATTQIEVATGRTRSLKHSVAGMRICREVLRELGCELVLREQIANLVRFHGRPPYLLEKDDTAREVISLSWLVNHRLLYLFALADTRGRVSKEMTRPEENLHFWKLAAEENGCFERPYPFANDQARFLFCRDALSNLHYVPREDFRCTVILMSGLPGSGKDTWLKRNRPELAVVSLDDLRAELDVDATDDQGAVIQKARADCRELLRAGRDFAFNATNTMRQTRKRWIDLFADYQARVEVIYLEPPMRTIVQNNSQRTKPVPSSVIHRLAEKLEPPTWTESHSLTMIG